ncbi:unnamed protein product [Rhizophagus irregularis]|uniref:Protein far1-related sequence 5-like n=1 Tax=Rhizophagus irregularis TaxID=588596 RepID=A0A915Z9X7_9GLOM|nr:unnamed protein product [Rhizophagus irregularis]
MNEWGKNKGFGIIKDRVTKEGDYIRRRTYICEHGKKYTSNSNKDTSTKKISCPWRLNASCSKENNPNSSVFINKVVDEHNHELNIEAIAFRESKRFSNEILEDIQFLTNHCKMGATAQRRYLEAKYPTHPLYSRDLYAAIQKFRPTTKSLSNDAAKMSNWLDQQKEIDSRWLIEEYPQSKRYLEGLYESRDYWAHSYTSFKFTGGMIASSRVESVNSCIKRMLFNSDVSLCELMNEIYKLLDKQDKKNRYQYWKLAIPSVKNQEQANFLFTRVDKSCQRFLTPAILKLQRDEINQSVYYVANLVEQWESTIDESYEEDGEYDDNLQATIDQLIEVGGRDNIKETWEIKVGIVCRHYFQVILNTQEAKFHVRLIPSRWYQENKDASNEPFIVADKFNSPSTTIESGVVVNNYLCAIDKEKQDSLEQRMNILDKKIMYGNLHGTYKKALQKALQKKSRSLRLIEILENFTNEDSSEDEVESDDESEEELGDVGDGSNEEVFQLQIQKLGEVKEGQLVQEGIKHHMKRRGVVKQSNGVVKSVGNWDIIKKIAMLRLGLIISLDN